MIEVYNETIRDLLLRDGAEAKKLDVRMSSHGNVIPGLSEVELQNLDQAMALMDRGDRNRAVSSHSMNASSSRSHSIVAIRIEGEREDGAPFTAKLHLIDLAGSERVSKTDASGPQLVEAQHINKSLSALGDVISALSSKNSRSHVPFRNSKLTFVLQDSLSGDAKVLMIVAVSPALYNVSETFSSLSFANRCRATELGAAKKSGDSAEVHRLRKSISKMQEAKTASDSSELQRIKQLEDQKQAVLRLEAEKASEVAKVLRMKANLEQLQEQYETQASEFMRLKRTRGRKSEAVTMKEKDQTRQKTAMAKFQREKEDLQRQLSEAQTELGQLRRTVKRLQTEKKLSSNFPSSLPGYPNKTQFSSAGKAPWEEEVHGLLISHESYLLAGTESGKLSSPEVEDIGNRAHAFDWHGGQLDGSPDTAAIHQDVKPTIQRKSTDRFASRTFTGQTLRRPDSVTGVQQRPHSAGSSKPAFGRSKVSSRGDTMAASSPSSLSSSGGKAPSRIRRPPTR